MKSIYFFIMAVVAFGMVGCKGSKDAGLVSESGVAAHQPPMAGSVPSAVMPKAVVYKTNGDFANNVFINLSSDGMSIVSYPAPSDVSVASEPISLGDGWLLDCRGGINKNSAFTTYTYADYAKLAKAPSIEELMKAVIPGAKVIETQLLPINASDAIANPAAAKKLIK